MHPAEDECGTGAHRDDRECPQAGAHHRPAARGQILWHYRQRGRLLEGDGRLPCAPPARRGAASRPSAANRYDWSAIRAYYEAGHPFVACRERFGFSGGSWWNAIERGDIVPREKDLGDYLTRRAFKRRLAREGLRGERCAECGIGEWRGKQIVLELHHVNGQKADHRPENVILLCPNCHSQTESCRARNRSQSGVA